MSRTYKAEKYAYISYQKRLKIIEMVYEGGFTIQKTATVLGINPSTARMIIKKYREEGTVFERKDEQKIRQIKEEIIKKESRFVVKSVEEEEQPIQWFFYLPVNEQLMWYPQSTCGNLTSFPV